MFSALPLALGVPAVGSVGGGGGTSGRRSGWVAGPCPLGVQGTGPGAHSQTVLAAPLPMPPLFGPCELWGYLHPLVRSSPSQCALHLQAQVQPPDPGPSTRTGLLHSRRPAAAEPSHTPALLFHMLPPFPSASRQPWPTGPTQGPHVVQPGLCSASLHSGALPCLDFHLLLVTSDVLRILGGIPVTVCLGDRT